MAASGLEFDAFSRQKCCLLQGRAAFWGYQLAGFRIAIRLTALTLTALTLRTLMLTALALTAMLAGPVVASAQQLAPPSGGVPAPSVFGAPRAMPQSQSIAPVYGTSSSASMPMPLLSAPSNLPSPGAGGSQQATLSLTARFGREAAMITNGLVWRIYPTRPEANGTFRPIREEKIANPMVPLPAGDYVVHVSCGLVSVAKMVHVKDATREVFELPAGGIKLEGRVGDVRIQPGAVTFDIFAGSQFEPTSKTPIAQSVQTGDVVVVPEGTYYFVSNYGDTNAVVRSDLRVQAGKLTEVTVSHRAALITLKLVGERGGDPIANTNWSVITPGGDVIKESTGIFPRIVLAEGDYRAIARNEGRTYERDFKVVTGVDGEIEVLAKK
jgi:hypothetical protein